MSIVPVRSTAITVIAILSLAACEEVATTGEPTVVEPGTVLQEEVTEIRVVERPDIFSTTELGLWDGRPTLGRGAWIAHPDVEDPEGVRVRNLVNGQTIRAALYRRERLSPGPRIQLSSTAAEELGALAGQPVELEVIAVREEEVVVQPALLAPEVEETADTVEPDETTSGADTEDTPPVEAQDDDSAAVPIAAAAAATTVVAANSAPANDSPGFWQKFRDSLKNEPEPDNFPEPIEPISITSATAVTAETAAAPEVETASLGAIAAATTALNTVEAEEMEVTADTPDTLQSPYIQIGLFSQRANASLASSALRQAGIVPTVSEGTGANGPFWRVLIGPVTSADDQTALLNQVKSLGYSDAYLTKN